MVANVKEELVSTIIDIETIVEAGNGTAACMASLVAKVGAADLGICPSNGAEALCDPTPDPDGGEVSGNIDTSMFSRVHNAILRYLPFLSFLTSRFLYLLWEVSVSSVVLFN